MSKNSVLFLLILIFFSSAGLAHAGLVINEVSYDLSGSDSTSGKSREWIEIYNPDGSDVAIDASTWRIYDGGANRTINGEVNFSIPAGAYVIFAGDKDTFLIDNAGFSGTIYDTGITSLNNTGATLKILDADGNTVDTFTYASSQGGAGDGNTLQKISGAWSGAAPTPGAANGSGGSSSPSGGSPGSLGSVSGSSTTSSNNTETKKLVVYDIKTTIKANTTALAGIPVPFEGFAYGHSAERLASGKYFWNFGDGDYRESKANYEEKFTHTYFYPGEYAVMLEYYANHYSDVPDAMDKITIKVVEPGVAISSLGDEKDFFVELTNETAYDADISKWVLKSDRTAFVLPKNTILGPKKKMMLSPYLTGFNISDKATIKLITSAGETVYDYMAFSAPAEASVPVPAIKTAKTSSPKPIAVLAVEENENEEVQISGSDLTASAISSGDQEGSTNSYIPIIAFTLFIGVASGGLYFIRRAKGLSAPGDDFELLDE